jgi:hypothetical protein
LDFTVAGLELVFTAGTGVGADAGAGVDLMMDAGVAAAGLF